ncbi:MAG: hypothetical protein R6W73_02085 [Candidatus Saliniplasma sp.]
MPLIRKKQETDPTTKKLIDQGIIRIKTDENVKDQGAKERIKEFGKVTYDFWSGVKYTLILSALLWWLPLFGPMLAGYVGGRRTGGPKKGLAAAISALGVIAIVHLAFSYSLVPLSVMELLKIPSALVATAYQRPMLAPYVNFLELYWSSFYASILGGLPYSPNSYVLTGIFAYIGGVISVEKKRELNDANSAGSTINIDLSSMNGQPNSNHRYTDRKKMLVNSNFNHQYENAKRASTPKRWEDLKAIQYDQNKRKKEKAKRKRKKKKSKSKKENTDEHRYQPVRFSSKPVRHHTNTEGDDWEFL